MQELHLHTFVCASCLGIVLPVAKAGAFVTTPFDAMVAEMLGYMPQTAAVIGDRATGRIFIHLDASDHAPKHVIGKGFAA